MSEQEITPESNLSYLLEHQAQLRHTSASADLSEISYHTDHTGFPGSRHSSLNTEPLTLDAEQIHEAKDEAIDVLKRVDSETAFDIFTKDSLTTILGRVSMMEYFWRRGGQDSQGKCETVQHDTDVSQQIDSLPERTNHEVEANQGLSQAIGSSPYPSVPGSLLHQDVKKRQNLMQQLSSSQSSPEKDLKQNESELTEERAAASTSSEQDLKEKKD